MGAEPRAASDFFRGLRAAHLGSIPHGIYAHVAGVTDAARGIGVVRALFQKVYGAATTVGLGDPLHDGSLLRAVDVPVVVGTLTP